MTMVALQPSQLPAWSIIVSKIMQNRHIVTMYSKIIYFMHIREPGMADQHLISITEQLNISYTIK